jgi:hypothetical protein
MMRPKNGPLRLAHRAVAALLALAAVVVFWSAAWRDLDASVLTLVPMLDEVHYLRTADELAASGWRPDGPFYMPPLYTSLVAVTGSGRQLDAQRVRLGAPPWGMRLLHVACWLGTAWLLWRVGAALYGRRWGWLPPLLWLGYLPAAVKVTQVLLEVPLTFAATLALAIAGGWLGRDEAPSGAAPAAARSAVTVTRTAIDRRAVLGWRRWPGLRPWLLAAVLVIAVQSVFFVVGRYRLILVPALALATCAALQAILLARGRTLARRLAVVLLAAAAVWPWNLAQARQQFTVQGAENLAIRWTHLAESRRQAADPAGAARGWQRAGALYAEALAADPWSVRRRLEAARVRLALQDTSAALSLLAGHPRGLAADPQLPRLAASLLLTAGRIGEAVPYLQAALAHDPRDPAQLHNLALALLHVGAWNDALALCDRLRDVEPERPRADLLAARALLALGRTEQAREVVVAALRRLPGEPQLQTLLERIEAAGAGN